MTVTADLKLPEEIELERKLAELDGLRSRHAKAAEALKNLDDEITRFEKVYQRTLGRRIAQLEKLEEEIERYTIGTCYETEAEELEALKGAYESIPAGSGAEAEADRLEEREIKALYREVAKAIHPDKAGDEGERAGRHELMSKANKAYQEEDRATLQAILRDWKYSAETVQGADIAAELIRVIRLIAREREAIEAVDARIGELQDSYLCRLKLRVDTNLTKGSDLFADLCAAADLNIERAKRRLASLKGETERQQAQASGEKTRTVCFPVDPACGTLYLRDRGSANFSQWRVAGAAKGAVAVGLDQALRLDIKEQVSANLLRIRDLGPDDLQALFLYGAADADIPAVVHLTGMEELYLSGSKLTDAALNLITSLANLKRLYLYQTQITDQGLLHLKRLTGLQGLTLSGNNVTKEGVATIERAIPGMKAIDIPVGRFAR